MTIANTCANLKTVLNGVTGVTSDSVTLTVKAYDPPPASLDSVKFPACYVFTGDAAFETLEMGATEYTVTRQYEVHCAVLAEGNATPELREKHVRPLLETVRVKLLQYPSLMAQAELQEMKVISDSGIVILPEYGGVMIGFIINIQTLEIVTRTYGAGE